MHHTYPLLNVQVRTPRLTLVGATDDLLERLVPIIRDGILDPGQMPFDDPMSLYEDSPQREWKWLRGIWRGGLRYLSGLRLRSAGAGAAGESRPPVVVGCVFGERGRQRYRRGRAADRGGPGAAGFRS